MEERKNRVELTVFPFPSPLFTSLGYAWTEISYFAHYLHFHQTQGEKLTHQRILRPTTLARRLGVTLAIIVRTERRTRIHNLHRNRLAGIVISDFIAIATERRT